MMSVMSSVTPLMVVNSWSASSKRTWVTAAPGIDDSSVRRNELPSVWPNPGSSGLMANRWRLATSSSIASTVGRWMTSMNVDTSEESRLLRVELDDQLLTHWNVDLGTNGKVAHGDLEATLARLQPLRGLTVEGVEVVADD